MGLLAGSAERADPMYGGFWGGCIINIFLGLFLKLVACAIQQQLIGGMLGNQLWVRALIGIHTPQVRCFQKIVGAKGFTLGKVAVLCGGPDWPTSVSAGILKCSLFQCELGTLP